MYDQPTAQDQAFECNYKNYHRHFNSQDSQTSVEDASLPIFGTAAVGESNYIFAGSNRDADVKPLTREDDEVNLNNEPLFNSTIAVPNTQAYTLTASTVTNNALNNLGLIICSSIDIIPPGRQSGKILKCGIPGCASTALFARKCDLQRHMQGHGRPKFPCMQSECSRRGNKAFARADKLREHMRKIHGI